MKNKKSANKAKVVKVEGCFTEWYAPDFKDPYEDNAEFAEFYEKRLLDMQPVIGPAVDGENEYLTGDLGCLADRITVDAQDWDSAKKAFIAAVELALRSGEEQVVDFHYTDPSVDDVKITPYKELPKIPEKAYAVYGKFAGLVKERVAAI